MVANVPYPVVACNIKVKEFKRLRCLLEGASGSHLISHVWSRSTTTVRTCRHSLCGVRWLFSHDNQSNAWISQSHSWKALALKIAPPKQVINTNYERWKASYNDVFTSRLTWKLGRIEFAAYELTGELFQRRTAMSTRQLRLFSGPFEIEWK
jgi:hypothetical protein